jgi:hypothetical protein
VALVRDGDQLKLFLDGVQQAQTAVSGNAPQDNFLITAGATYSGSGYIYPWRGQMDELRITKGAARWKTNFTAPTTERDYFRDEKTSNLFHFNPTIEPEIALKELSEILLSRPVHNALTPEHHLQTAFTNGTKLFVGKLNRDAARGDVYDFSSTYSPQWNMTQLNSEDHYRSFLMRSQTMDVHDHLPSTIAELVDMNGDGLPDRVFTDSGTNVGYWHVQLNTGSGFEAPVKWYGVNQRPDLNCCAMV